MPIKLIPSQLRLLNHQSSLSLTRLAPMKFTHSFQSTASAASPPMFSRVFPFKLKYSGLGVPVLKNGPQQLGIRKLSTRALKPRGSGDSGFMRGSRERGEIRAASKSLVEDEAELSDWVSDLKVDSYRGRVTSDEEDSEMNRRRSSVRSKSMDNGYDNGSQFKRRREGDSGGGFREPTRGRGGGRGGGRRSFESSSSFRGSRGNGASSDDSDGERQPRMSTRGGARGGSSSFASQRGGRDSSFRDRRDLENSDRRSSSGGSRGSSSSFGRGGLSRGGRDSSFGSRRDTENRNDELFPRRSNESGSRGGSSSFESRRGGSSRGGRGTDFAPRRDQRPMGSAERAPVDSEDEDDDVDDDEDKISKNFKYLLDEEDSEDEDDSEDEREDVSVIKKSASSLFGAAKEVSEKVSAKTSSGQNDSYLSESRFDECSVSPLTLKAVKDAGYEKMTMVQEATLPVILKGKDVLAKAKTGTGKTVAFLLPSIEVVVNSPPVDRDQKRPPIQVLVICPTRELASQAANEATKLLKYHPSIGVQVVIGGTRLPMEQKRMQANPCQILVATPGRLKDHIENTAGFATRMMGVKVLILDEADHLLDMGFRRDIERIIAAVPKQRQTLLFSATVPEEVRQICHVALKRDHEFINAVQEGSEDTHAQVKQMHLVAPLDKHFSLLYALLKEHISDDVDYKVLVFCTTAMVTKLVASLLGELNMNVREIHSRKPQSYRTRVSDEFRKSKGLILVTSDVSARGVDYPDVTLVIQVGVPSDREQYIHRLGRTGRKGKEGQGILLLAPWEEYFLSSIKDLPISKAPVPSVDPETRKKVERGLSQTEMKNKESAYQAWLGYYNSNKNVGKDKQKLVELANDFSRSMGLDTPPAIPKQILGKMGLRNIPGLRSK